MTETTGILHDAQVLQLKVWPRLAMPHATSVQIGWSASKRTVEFTAKLGKDKAPKDLVKRLKGLDDSVKGMLGRDVTVVVKVGTKSIFASAGKKKKSSDKAKAARAN